MRRGLLAISCALSMLGGCASKPPKVSLAAPPQSFKYTDYQAVLDSWTRKTQIIKDYMDTTLRVHATWHSPEFSDAYVAKYAHVFKLPARDRSQLERRLASETAADYRFLVAAATADSRWNDFDRKQSVWRIALVNDKDQQVLPREVIAERRIDVTFAELYPYIARFDRIYHIRFPKKLPDGSSLIPEGTQQVTLRLAGPLGHAELVWRLKW